MPQKKYKILLNQQNSTKSGNPLYNKDDFWNKEYFMQKKNFMKYFKGFSYQADVKIRSQIRIFKETIVKIKKIKHVYFIFLAIKFKAKVSKPLIA